MISLADFKRVLITGSGGVLGTAVLSLLREQPGMTLAHPGRRDCDLLDTAATHRYFSEFRPDLVLHLAGKVFGVQGNLDFGGQSYYENTIINLNVVEAARLAGARKVVAAGTAAIYSDIAPLPMREADLWLGAPHGSEGPYGHAKRGMLAQLEAYKTQYGLDFAYLILTNLYGPNDKFDEIYGHVVPSLISRFCRAVNAATPKVTCWGDGSPTRDFLYAEDAANAFLVAAAQGNGAMNVATGQSVPIRTLVDTIVRHTGFAGEVEWDVTKPLGQKERSYDINRITSSGWKPNYSLDQGIKATVDWFVANSDKLRT
jgi:GDP-L-fucose synthase